MKIKTIITGYLEENCYILIQDNNCLIVDPGDNYKEILNEVSNYNLKGILITHYHFDHVLCLDDVLKEYNVEVVDYKNRNKISPFIFEISENYGHTMDSVSFYFRKEKIMFTGDFVFKDSIGKYDYYNENIMYESLKRFCTLDDDIVIYPGHGESFTIGYEKENNYFLRGI